MFNASSVSKTVPALISLTACLFIAAPSTSLPALADSDTTKAAQAGDKAPGFKLPGIDGKEHKLSDYKGKLIVLEWFNDGCPFVKKHYNSQNMQNLQKEYKAKGVVWLTIDSSAPGRQGHHTQEEFQKIEKDWGAEPTAFLVDEDGKVGHLYGAKSTPHMFVIDKSGQLVYAGAIDDTPGTEESEIASAKNYVKAALDEALAGKKVAVATTKSYGCSVKYMGSPDHHRPKTINQ